MKKILTLISIIIILLPINLCGASKAVVDITDLSIKEIQENIDKGYLTYELLTKLYLERIEKYNTSFNALISINENAIEEAKSKDIEYKKNGRDSLLFGIPVILKDNIDYKFLPTTAGTKALKESYPNNNSKVVENLLNAGVIILGKANMSEFAFSAANSYSSYGHVKNVYNKEYTPYGSSGGSAVSVSAYFSTISLGTDTSSSVRLPASAANVVGLRPTYGLLSAEGVIKYDVTRDTVGPISNTVEDNAITLSSIANNGIDYTKFLNIDGLKGKKIGVLNDFIKKQNSKVPVLNAFYDESEKLITEAIKIMKDNGAQIVYIDNFYNQNENYIYDITSFGITMCYQFNQYIKNTDSKIKSFQGLLNVGGYVQPLSGYNSSCDTDLTKSSKYETKKQEKEDYKRRVYDLMDKENVDILIYPSLKGEYLTIKESSNSYVNSPSYTISPNTGMPAISIPMGFDSKGLPYGLEMVAKENREDLLYEVAYSFEQHTNHRKLSELVPSLYEIPEEILKLKKYYENDNYKFINYPLFSYKKYKKSYEKLGEYLKNYNETKEDSKIILEEYQSSKRSLHINKVITIIIVLAILYFIIRNKKKNIRKRKRKY